jgi:5-methylcytosine-specific restriction enzyme A
LTKALKICLEPGCFGLSDQSRCPEHRRARERFRGSAAARGYDARYRRLRKQAIDAHIARYGQVCPGYGVSPHTATRAELSVDHIVPLADGGRNDPSNFQVICLTCNKRKGRATDVAVDRPLSRSAASKPATGHLIA